MQIFFWEFWGTKHSENPIYCSSKQIGNQAANFPQQSTQSPQLKQHAISMRPREKKIEMTNK